MIKSLCRNLKQEDEDKNNIPDSLADKMALFQSVDFNKMAVEAIENYVSENKPRLTFEEKAARAALKIWREMVWLLFYKLA